MHPMRLGSGVYPAWTLEEGHFLIDSTGSTCYIFKTPMTRGGAAWKLVGLITRRSQVQILPPLPNKIKGLDEFLSPFPFGYKNLSNPISNPERKTKPKIPGAFALELG